MRTNVTHGAAALALAVSLAACGGGAPAAEAHADTAAAKPAVVLAAADLATAASVELRGGVALTGTLEPGRVADVKAQVGGVLEDLSVDRGSAVGQGQLLARIEAQGITSQAGGARAQVAAAEAALAQARRQLESSRTLYEAGALSEIAFRAAETQEEAARAQVAAARAAAAGAGEMAARTRVVAPVAGRVSDRKVNEGEAVNPGDVLLTVVDSRNLELRGQVPVDQASQVRAGQAVEFTLNAYPGRTFAGTVARVDPVADPGTRQVGVTLRLPNPDGTLIGGMFAAGRVATGGTTTAVAVPAAAVRGSGTETFVWVVKDGVASRRAVAVGERDEARGVIAIARGVAAGEQVVAAPGELEEGARVTVRADDTAPTGGER